MPTVTIFYVRGLESSHDFAGAPPGPRVWCYTCGLEHSKPVGREWHIEDPADVDRMICGMYISCEEGEVRESQPRAVCRECSDGRR